MDCNIIRDLMPLYCDGQASEQSRALVEEHLKTCEECKRLYELMSEIQRTDQAEDEAAKAESPAGMRERPFVKDPFKKIRRKSIIKTGAISIAVTAILVAIFLWFFWGIIPAESKDCEITPKAYIGTRDDGVTWEVVSFDVKLTNGKCIDARSRDREVAKDIRFEKWMTVYDQYRIPFDDRGEFPGEFECGWGSETPFTDKDVAYFEFRDRTVEFNLKEIAEKAGLQ